MTDTNDGPPEDETDENNTGDAGEGNPNFGTCGDPPWIFVTSSYS